MATIIDILAVVATVSIFTTLPVDWPWNWLLLRGLRLISRSSVGRALSNFRLLVQMSRIHSPGEMWKFWKVGRRLRKHGYCSSCRTVLLRELIGGL